MQLDVYSSEESDPEESYAGCNTWAWDAKELRRIQIDEYTKKRRYRKITCERTSKRQDQDWFVYDWTIGIWSGKRFYRQDTVYQYLLAELAVIQNMESGDIKSIRLKIRGFDDCYKNDKHWVNHLKDNVRQEHFMAQDT